MDTQNVKFYLKRPASDEPTSIYVKIQLNKRSFKYYIRKSIYPILWDISTGIIKNDRETIKEWKKFDPNIKTTLDNIQTRINLIRDTIVTYINLKEQAGDTVSGNDLKVQLDSKIGVINTFQKEDNVIEYTKRYISEMENGIRLTHSKTIFSIGTIKNYKGFLVQLIEFQEEQRKILRFDSVTTELYDKFIEFFNGKDYSLNTVGRHIKSLKVLMKKSQNEGLHDNDEYKSFHVPTAKVDSIYLNEDEIHRIFLFDLKEKPNLELARDIFLIGCYTALRYSDYSRIKPHHIHSLKNGQKVIRIRDKKNDKPTLVPIRKELYEILSKYELDIPTTQEQKVNAYIKEVGKIVGLSEKIEILQIKGGKKIRKLVPKFTLITTHTARRSAATNMFLSGVPPILIMKITNHSTEKDFLKYIKVGREEAAQILSSHPFFS